MSPRVPEHALRLFTSLTLMSAIIIVAALLAQFAEADPTRSHLVGWMIFWPTILFDRIFIPDPDYMDLEIMFASLFISTGSYTLVVYSVLSCLSRIKRRHGKISIGGRA